MATEITAAGYQSLREKVADSWTYVGVRNGTTEHFRLPLSDPRVSLESDGEGNPVTFRVELAGNDSEIDGGPVTIDNTALYDVDTGGDILSTDSFVEFTFGSEEDELTIRHHIQVPEIV